MPGSSGDDVGSDGDGDAWPASLVSTEYASGRTRTTVTAGSALNDLREALEAVSSRVHGEKPKDSYEPRTSSRADAGVPEELCAELEDGTRIDALQLLQEVAAVVRGIAAAPSAAKRAAPKKARGGSAPAPDPAPVSALEGSAANAPESLPAMIGQLRQVPTFGGQPSPEAAPALARPAPVATYGGQAVPALAQPTLVATPGDPALAPPSHAMYAMPPPQIQPEPPNPQPHGGFDNVEPDPTPYRYIYVPGP